MTGAGVARLRQVIHASAVGLGPELGVLVTGPSGSGKSSLAWALIGAGATLVADDRTLVFATSDGLFARAPRTIAGLIERRGLGLLRLPALPLVRLRLLVDLTPGTAARLPEPAPARLLGHVLDRVALPAGADDPAALARAIALILRRGPGAMAAGFLTGAQPCPAPGLAARG